ncbi:MAG: hypothetical protein KKH68_12880, partial [Proteobacteria bacterium]|nr:hypothetical protein [Pseudomonadota bacterium]
DWAEGSDQSRSLLERSDLARRVVREHGLYFMPGDWDSFRNAPTYRNIERTIYGKGEISDAEMEHLWVSIALHQYVQRPMKNKDERPDANDYKAGAIILKEILGIMKPRLCIFLGTDWKKIGPISEYAVRSENKYYEKINGSCPRVFTYGVDGQEAKLLMIKHTSKYFSWDKWHSEFLATEAPEYLQHMKAPNLNPADNK